ncbi:hypothetical protein CsatB_000847 [Cannabis sativa]
MGFSCHMRMCLLYPKLVSTSEEYTCRAEKNKELKHAIAFNQTEVEFKLANVQKIWQRFLYRNSTMLEAERQFSQMLEDDVFATFYRRGLWWRYWRSIWWNFLILRKRRLMRMQ